MPSYVAFLRGMNLGSRRIKNDELRAEFEALGFADVATFRASGNVIFGAEGQRGEAGEEIEAGLADALGYEVPVFLRSAAEVAAIAAQEPFDAEEVEGLEGQAPGRAAAEEADGRGAQEGAGAGHRRGPPGDRGPRALLAAERRHLRIRARPEGDRGSARPGTMRTMGTIEQIAAKHCA